MNNLKKFFLYVFILFFICSGLSLANKDNTQTLSPEEALQKLKEGNYRYSKSKRLYPNLSAKRKLQTVENGQHPFATVIGCSDSRAPIEHIFDAGIGDIFVIRVAGNVSDVDEAGSIEYGVDHLGTPVFVVLGHSGCGAVTAVSRGDKVHGNIPALVDNIVPAVKKVREKLGKEFNGAFLAEAIKENVWQSINDLLEKSHSTVERVKSNKLKIIGAVYHLDSGEVEWLGEHPKQAELISKYGSFYHNTLHGLSTKHFLIRISSLSILILLFLTITYIIAFKESKKKKKMNVKTRILIGYLSLLISFIIFLLFMPVVIKNININLTSLESLMLIISATLIPFIFIFAFTGSVINSFRKVINLLKSKIE